MRNTMIQHTNIRARRCFPTSLRRESSQLSRLHVSLFVPRICFELECLPRLFFLDTNENGVEVRPSILSTGSDIVQLVDMCTYQQMVPHVSCKCPGTHEDMTHFNNAGWSFRSRPETNPGHGKQRLLSHVTPTRARISSNFVHQLCHTHTEMVDEV